MGRTGRLTGVVSIAVVLAAGAFSAVTDAETLAPETREAYVSELETMCKPQAEETRQAMAGVRDDVRNQKRIGIAARKFSRAAQIFGGTISKISQVPPPPADSAKIKEWFVYLNRQEDYLKQIAAELKGGRTIKAQRLTARFIHNGNLANNVTLAFGFDYCSFKFSRYG